MEFIKENERIDDLQCKGLKIIQNEQGFCFGIDSILLSNFAKDIKHGSKVVDLGTGTGIIGILLCAKTRLKSIIGVEIQSEVADMAKRTIKLNNLEEKFMILNCNIKQLDEKIEKNSIDVVVSNPPYKKINTGEQNINMTKTISRHEIEANLDDFIRTTKNILKDKGEFYMVHRPDRLVDIIEILRKYKLEPKIIRFVFSNQKKVAKLVLIKAVKNANPFLKIERPLIIYQENGEYTKEILEIYKS